MRLHKKRVATANEPPVVDATDAAGLHVLLLEAVTRPVRFGVRVSLPQGTMGNPAKAVVLEVVARTAVTGAQLDRLADAIRLGARRYDQLPITSDTPWSETSESVRRRYRAYAQAVLAEWASFDDVMGGIPDLAARTIR